MRLVLMFAALAGVLFVDVPGSRAHDGNNPWCAMVNTGHSNLAEICSFRTFEECRPFVIAGNRGFCEENRRYTGKLAQRHGKRRVKAY